MMKKYLYALGLLALPAFSTMAFAAAGESDDDFLKDPETTTTVVRYYGQSGVVKARISATKGGDADRIITKGVEGDLEGAGWKNDDDSLNAIPLRIGNIEIGLADFLRQSAPYGAEVVYTSEDDTTDQPGTLPVNEMVAVHNVQNWVRPDGSSYSKIGEALFRLKLEETHEVVPGEFKILQRSWGEIQRRGLKTSKRTRHEIANHSQEQVTRTVTKFAVDSDDVLEGPTLETWIALTRTGTYESWDNESGRGQGNVPEGYRLS